MKTKKEAEQIQSIIDNSKVSITIECSICGETDEAEVNDLCAENPPTEEDIKNAAKELYDRGWRDAVSKVFNQIGIICPTCYPNRNNAKFFE